MDPHPRSLDEIELISPDFYARHGYPFRAWKLLRDEVPLHRYDRLEGQPFWALRHRLRPAAA